MLVRKSGVYTLVFDMMVHIISIFGMYRESSSSAMQISH